MKTALVSLFVIYAVSLSPAFGEDDKLKVFAYKSLPRFGIPTEFYTEHDYRPANYLHRYNVPDMARKLDHAEKLSAALLILAANHATYKKYHQSYGVDMDCSLMELLRHNFTGLEKVKPTHDVERNHLPIRDLGDFFKKWLTANTDAERAAQGADIGDNTLKVYKLPYTFLDLLIHRLGEDKGKHRVIKTLLKLEGVVFNKGSIGTWRVFREPSPYGELIIYNKPSEIIKMDQVIKEMKVKMEDLTSEYLENGRIILPETKKQNK